MKKKNVAVLTGGPSSERKVSLESGKNVFNALLRSQKYNPFFVEIDLNKNWHAQDKGFKKPLSLTLAPNNFLINHQKIDIVFIALHGHFGEDGKLQGLLESFNIPYTGSGSLTSALCMNKFFTKKILKAENIPTPPFLSFSKEEWLKRPSFVINSLLKNIKLPLVIKPCSEGSSIGVSIVKKKSQLNQSLKEAFSLDSSILGEKFIPGREIQVGILGNQNPYALPPIEIVPKKEFFDYEAKYNPHLAQEITPAPLTRKETQKVQTLCLKVYQLLDCQGFSRIDTFLTKNGEFLISEVNTIPGLTKNSLFPKEAQAARINFLELIERIIELGLELGCRG